MAAPSRVEVLRAQVDRITPDEHNLETNTLARSWQALVEHDPSAADDLITVVAERGYPNALVVPALSACQRCPDRTSVQSFVERCLFDDSDATSKSAANFIHNTIGICVSFRALVERCIADPRIRSRGQVWREIILSLRNIPPSQQFFELLTRVELDAPDTIQTAVSDVLSYWLTTGLTQNTSVRGAESAQPDPAIVAKRGPEYRTQALNIVEEMADRVLDTAKTQMERTLAHGALSAVGFLRAYVDLNEAPPSIGQAALKFASALADVCLGDRAKQIRKLGQALRDLCDAFLGNGERIQTGG